MNLKTLIILNLEDCTFDEIEEAGIKAINLVAEDKETGKEFEFEWETGFKIMPMPQKREIDNCMECWQRHYIQGINDTISRIEGTLIQIHSED